MVCWIADGVLMGHSGTPSGRDGMRLRDRRRPRAGVSYTIAPGGAYTSNKVPFAPKATADNDWGFDPPHVMVLVTDKRALEGLPTTRQDGGPWVMWTGTQYAHIMVPIASTKK
jgi:hypothetical protein